MSTRVVFVENPLGAFPFQKKARCRGGVLSRPAPHRPSRPVPRHVPLIPAPWPPINFRTLMTVLPGDHDNDHNDDADDDRVDFLAEGAGLISATALCSDARAPRMSYAGKTPSWSECI